MARVYACRYLQRHVTTPVTKFQAPKPWHWCKLSSLVIGSAAALIFSALLRGVGVEETPDFWPRPLTDIFLASWGKAGRRDLRLASDNTGESLRAWGSAIGK